MILSFLKVFSMEHPGAGSRPTKRIVEVQSRCPNLLSCPETTSAKNDAEDYEKSKESLIFDPVSKHGTQQGVWDSGLPLKLTPGQ
jgi:hypothetical protein